MLGGGSSGVLTDSMTAPVTGSWGLPAWTARVPNLCTGDAALGGVSIGWSAGDMMQIVSSGTVRIPSSVEMENVLGLRTLL